MLIETSGFVRRCIWACRKFLLTSFSSSREKNMIVITQPNATEEQIQRIITRVREFGLEAQISRGASRVIIGVIGPEALLREKAIAAMPGVEGIVPVLKPY